MAHVDPAVDELRAALLTWRDSPTPLMTRNAELADAIDMLTHAALRTWTPPATTLDARSFQRAWLGCTDDIATRGWAATTLTDRLPGITAGQQAGAFAKRVARLARAGGDPRVGRAIVELLEANPPILDVKSAFDACVPALVASIDDRLRARIEVLDVLGGPRRITSVVEAIRPVRRSRPPTLEIDRPGATPEMPVELEGLWRDVLANPDDDGARSVLADALQSRGDPRGELIALQLAPALDEAGHARIDELLREHGSRWLGPLQTITSRAHFSRGFVTRLELRNLDEEAFAGFDAEPGLATIEAFVVGAARGVAYKRIACSRAAISLHDLEVFDGDSLDAFATTRAPLLHVAVSTRRDSEPHSYLRRLRAVLPMCERHPTLRSIAMTVRAFAEVADRRELERFTELMLAGPVRSCLAAWPRIPAATSLAVVPDSRLEGCTTDARDYSLRVGRDGIVRITGEWMCQSIDDAIASLPPHVTRIELFGMSDELATRVGAAIAHTPIELAVHTRRVTRNVVCT